MDTHEVRCRFAFFCCSGMVGMVGADFLAALLASGILSIRECGSMLASNSSYRQQRVGGVGWRKVS